MKAGNPQRVAFWVVLFARLLLATVRIRIVDKIGVRPGEWNEPSIWVFWHNRLLVIPEIWRLQNVKNKMVGLTSLSRDGAFTEAVMNRYGIECVRGSTSRGGATAIREMTAVLKRGDMIAIVPDGPRGPRYRFQPGALWLASKAGFPIGTVGISYSSCWRLKSWDRFIIPKPFSTITVELGPLMEIPSNLTPEAFEEMREGLQRRLMEASKPE